MRKAQATELVMAKLAQGTRHSYSTGWHQWTLFLKARGRDPVLLGKSAGERHDDEELLLDFIVHLALYMHRAAGTIQQRLFAVRYYHLVGGLEDPLKDKGRVWFALGGLRRLQGGRPRKRPVTRRMLRWLARRLQGGTFDEQVLLAAILTAFFFLLRAGEYVSVDGKPWNADRILCGKDVFARKGGRPVASFRDGDEVLVHIKSSKTDQYNLGCLRNHYRAGGEVCPVRAMEAVQRLAPERWGLEAHLPLFRRRSGRVLRRAEIQDMLAMAAIVEGFKPEEMGSHSLRIGGATALYHTTQDIERVKRFGRWKSNAVHAYLWEAHEHQKGLAAAMAGDTARLIKREAMVRPAPAAAQGGR